MGRGSCATDMARCWPPRGSTRATPPTGSLSRPTDPDAAARDLKAGVESALTVAPLAVIVTDTLGRAWRNGQVDTAIGAGGGIDPLLDLAGSVDSHGRRLAVTAPAVADEVAAMADLVKGKLPAGRWPSSGVGPPRRRR